MIPFNFLSIYVNGIIEDHSKLETVHVNHWLFQGVSKQVTCVILNVASMFVSKLGRVSKVSFMVSNHVRTTSRRLSKTDIVSDLTCSANDTWIQSYKHKIHINSDQGWLLTGLK